MRLAPQACKGSDAGREHTVEVFLQVSACGRLEFRERMQPGSRERVRTERVYVCMFPLRGPAVSRIGRCWSFHSFRTVPPVSDSSRLRPGQPTLNSGTWADWNRYLLLSTMAPSLQHQFLTTPHITPHIHHTKYAHSPENDTPNQCKHVSLCVFLFSINHVTLQSSVAT